MTTDWKLAEGTAAAKGSRQVAEKVFRSDNRLAERLENPVAVAQTVGLTGDGRVAKKGCNEAA